MKIKKILTLLMILLLITGCQIIKDEEQAVQTSDVETNEPGAFKYIHDPRDNPEAMKDIMVDHKAVYGFSPDPQSTRLGTYAEYDWSDPKFVAEAKKNRQEYHKQMASMTDILYKMKADGASTEEIARAVSGERNRLRLESQKDHPEDLARIKQSNLDTYGHEEGPTPEQMFEKYGSWENVIQKAFSPSVGMDVICGLYDDNYQLYKELGLVEIKAEQ